MIYIVVRLLICQYFRYSAHSALLLWPLYISQLLLLLISKTNIKLSLLNKIIKESFSGLVIHYNHIIYLLGISLELNKIKSN